MDIIYPIVPIDQKQIEDVIVYSQAYPFQADCKPLLKQWEKAKRLFLTSDGFAIYRSAEKYTFKSNAVSNKQNFKNFYKDVLGYTDDKNFLSFLQLNEKTFFENRVSVADEPHHIVAGAKLSRAFKEFFEDKELVKMLQDLASRYMQLTQVTGYIYLSVHPMDYLTLSENAANWTSCHALDGDYRMGNLSYMVDNATIVAYLASDEMQHFKCLPDNMKWFSKKWRMLLHINSNSEVMYYNKQYPFEHQELFYKVMQMAHQVFFPKERRFYNECIAFRNIETKAGLRPLPEIMFNTDDGDGIIPASKIIHDNRLFYNDLRYSATYLPIIDASFGTTLTEKNMHIFIGKNPCCPICGKKTVRYISSKMLCMDCKNKYDAYDEFYPYCAECGHRIYPSDKAYELDGVSVCKSCYHSLNDIKEFKK